jgi:hypothetical protein
MKIRFLAFFLLLAALPLVSFAQMARKPSPTREPNGAMAKKPESNKRALLKVASQADFDAIARTYHQNTPFALPHTMFVIDRKSKNKIYFVNSQKFRFHKDFLLAAYLVPRGDDVFKPIYIDEKRRFIVGTIAWQKPVEKFTWELWEGDMATAEHIKLANAVINQNFFQPVAYKPNSFRQEELSAPLNIARVLQSDIAANQEYLALNTGTAIGRIHIIDKLDDTVEIGDNEIVILKELPLNLPPVAGIIVAKPSTPLSHVNILAKGWGIPNVYIKDADKLFKELDTRWIKLEANLTDYKYKPANKEILDAYKPPDVRVPQVNLNTKTLTGLKGMRKRDSIIYGAKAANLGEMLNSKIAGITVPDGFSVPFHWYDKFMKAHGFNNRIEELMEDLDFVHNPRVRRQKLDEFRKAIQAAPMDESLRADIIQKWKTQLGSKPVFVRSSSNSEDLPNFSGAGLYSSAANVTTEDQLIAGVKKVWSSLWNFQAYEARVRNYVSQTDVYMSALVQLGVNMDRGGVMITKDPFDAENDDSVYISAVCGHNSKVVDNDGLPEQILVNPRSKAVVVMTRSQQKNVLAFAEDGGLEEKQDICSRQGRVLNDIQARALSKVALDIKQAFGGKKEQDIEWGLINGKIYIVQSRPYIEKK